VDLISLDVVTAELSHAAAAADSKRAGRTLYGGAHAVLRQTVIALVAGAELAEHESPGEATLLVLSGRVRLTAGEDAREAGPRELFMIPDGPHSLAAVEDAVVMLTVAKAEAAQAPEQGRAAG
jgi:quercetin dioxygenase-like cupin family protein